MSDDDDGEKVKPTKRRKLFILLSGNEVGLSVTMPTSAFLAKEVGSESLGKASWFLPKLNRATGWEVKVGACRCEVISSRCEWL